jgi:hypothetical protein
MWAAVGLALLFLPRVLFALPGGEAPLHKKTLFAEGFFFHCQFDI